MIDDDDDHCMAIVASPSSLYFYLIVPRFAGFIMISLCAACTDPDLVLALGLEFCMPGVRRFGWHATSAFRYSVVCSACARLYFPFPSLLYLQPHSTLCDVDPCCHVMKAAIMVSML